MTKQEIIQSCIPHSAFDPGVSMFTEVISPAMDEYAKQQAVAFAEWIASQDGEYKLVLIDNDWYWESDTDGDQPLTSEYLYTIFISQQSITENASH